MANRTPGGKSARASGAWVAGALSVTTGCTNANGQALATAAPPRPGDDAPGEVGPQGGKVARLLFAGVGDSRPPYEDDTGGYPVNVVSVLFSRIQALAPRVPFVIATGDYVFSSTGSRAQAEPQFDLYLQARSVYTGLLFPALGNHECTGTAASNCGPDAVDGVTPNYSAFVAKMLAPIQRTDPYYSVSVDGVDGSWSAKFVFIAANAWTSSQQSWLSASLARPTTYTFVVRHEPASADEAPGVIPSEEIMSRYPYTLALVGHTHTYGHYADSPREVLIGNGGAPLSSKNYGFAVFGQRSDGAIAVDMIDWQTGLPDAAFHFAVTPSGDPAP
jgi:hypothetical protein